MVGRSQPAAGFVSKGSHLRGVVLAGGRGNRLMPLTRVVNKHLLPVYDKPMIFHGLEAMARAGVREVMVVADASEAAEFRRVLSDPEEHGLERLEVGVQAAPLGIADAVSVVEPFTDGRDFLVLLGDNLFGDALAPAAAEFAASTVSGMVLLTRVENPREFGVARFGGSDGQLVEIIEKPDAPPTDLAVTGAYFYRASVFQVIRELRRGRAEVLEITDVNNALLKRGELDWCDVEGWWADAGTIEGLRHASNLVAEHGVNGLSPRRHALHGS